MNIPDDLKYTKDHEWARVEGNIAVIGVTDHAQQELGDIVFVELPDVDDEVTAEDTIGSVESTKAVSDLYSPISGKVVEVNEALEDNPGLINTSPYTEGWMLKIEISDAAELDDLMDAGAYKDLVESEEN